MSCHLPWPWFQIIRFVQLPFCDTDFMNAMLSNANMWVAARRDTGERYPSHPPRAEIDAPGA
jgi:hypothetical protein